MAKRLYVESNYIKVDGDNGLISEYPKTSFYDTRDGHLKLTHPDGFKTSFIDPTEWLDSEVGGVFYTYDTMEAFFEQNSAFSTASVGGASDAAYIARWDFSAFAAAEATLLKNDTGLAFTANKDAGVGNYSLQLAAGTFADIDKILFNIECCQTLGKFVKKQYLTDRVEFIYVNTAGSQVDFTGTDIDLSLTIYT